MGTGRSCVKRFDCLVKDLCIKAPHFLKASAGTGKTFAIEHIVTRLVLEENIDIKKILVVTFTKAATRELKQRIRKRLELSTKILSGKHTNDGVYYLENLSDELRKTYLERAAKALCFFDETEIYTIHGFCFRVLSEYSFESNCSFSSSIEEMQHLKVLKDEIFHVLKAEISHELFSPSQLEIYFKTTGKDLLKITKKITQLLLRDAEIPPLVFFSDFCRLFQQAIRSYAEEFKNLNLEEDMKKLGKVFKGLNQKNGSIHLKFLEQLELLKKMSTASCIKKDLDELISKGGLFLECLTEENLRKKPGYDLKDITSYPFFLNLKENILNNYKEAINPIYIELKIAKLCLNKVKKALSALDLFSPDDILKRMQACIGIKNFKNLVQQRYEAALIDEFQDTDPIQWDIFHTLFPPEQGFALYLIGDPKQSIYGFRSADMLTYQEAERVFQEDKIYSLDTNYRSVSSIIDTLNVLFSEELSKGWLSDDNSLFHSKIKAGVDKEKRIFVDDKKSVHFALVEGKKALTHFPSQDLEEFFIFPWIAREILSIKKQNVSLNQIAILIKDRFQAQRLEKFLKNLKIDCLCKNTSHIKTTEAFGFIKALLAALAHPFEKNFLKILFAHPFIGLTHREIKDETKPFLQAVVHIRRLSSIFSEKGFSSFWIDFLGTSFKEVSFISYFLRHFEERHYHDLLRLTDILLQKVALAEESVEAYLNVLNSLLELDENEDVMVKRSQISADDAVQIMTTHMSKGLEFDVVFALGISSRGGNVEKIIKVREGKKNVLEAFSEDNEKHQGQLKKNMLEKARLLYVALTRAKTRVYIPVCFEEGATLDEVEKSPLELFLSKLASGFSKEKVLSRFKKLSKEVDISFECMEKIENPEEITCDREKVVLDKERTQFSFTASTEYVHSFSSMAAHNDFEQSAIFPDNPPLSFFFMPPSKETGTIMHKILEKSFERGFYQENNEMRLSSFIKAELDLTHLEGYTEAIVQALKKLFDLPLFGESKFFSFKDIKIDQLLTEANFLFLDKGQGLFKGFIDLIFVHNTTFYIVDWKTNYLGDKASDYNRKNLEKVMIRQKYDLQAALYAKALQLNLAQAHHLTFGGAFYIFLRALETTENPIYFLSEKELLNRLCYV